MPGAARYNSPFWCPAVRILRELPVLASGKIDHAQLSERAAQTLAEEDQPRSDASDVLELQLVPDLGKGYSVSTPWERRMIFLPWEAIRSQP